MIVMARESWILQAQAQAHAQPMNRSSEVLRFFEGSVYYLSPVLAANVRGQHQHTVRTGLRNNAGARLCALHLHLHFVATAKKLF